MNRKWIGVIIVILIFGGAAAIYGLLTNGSDQGAVDEVPGDDTELLVAPFTGQHSDESFDHRTVTAVIDNHPLARPHTGLGEADMVLEVLAEGNVTRFLALYQSEMPDNIGPLRSARSYFVDLAAAYESFFIAHGFSPEAKRMLEAGAVDNINGIHHDGTLFRRSTDRHAPHNSYISYDNIREAMEMTDASPLYSSDSPYRFYEPEESGKLTEEASGVKIIYGNNPAFENSFSYDGATGLYSRTSGGIPTTDKETGDSLTFSNVLFLEAEHERIDDQGRLLIDLDSGGDALLFQDGKMSEAEWRPVDGMPVPFIEGEPAQLIPGKTWIHMVPASPGMNAMIDYTP
ncbi:MAG TPA: DUF3048 domain-containing protein [Planococcus sp. (in: firmicutes)]|nr:DUF3048 domain-containing protein [Planococcus sp. (in: firmicutes)]